MQEPGTVVGERYKLVRKIGEGGIAAVWQGEHLTLGSSIAIKFLHRTGPMQSEASQRFLREARVAASVRHRNVVEIIDFGFAEGEIPYMVMELLEGRSLGSYLEEKGRLPPAEAAQIVAGTLRGLVAVHAAGLVHRDIKPDNVFLVSDPEEGTFAKLVDFGLSRRAGRSDMTAEGTLMGTPQYMSPEQAAGSADIDGRTDVYAMGVVLYELVSGRVPFDSDSLAEVLSSVIHERPKSIRELVPDVPEKLEFVIETAMAKDREHRFVDARAMRTSLVDSGLYTAHEPVSGLIATPPLDDGVKARRASPTLDAPRVGGSGPEPRRDSSQRRERDESDEVAVFAVSREEAVAKPVAAPERASMWPVGLVVVLLVAIAGVVIALVTTGGLPGSPPPALAGPSDAAVSDASAPDDAWAAVDAGVDAARQRRVDAAREVAPEPAHRPTKRARRRPRRHR